MIRYILKLANEKDEAEIKATKEEFNKTISEIEEYKKVFRYSVRIYLLNATGLRVSDSATCEEGYVWIKRYDDDREYKDEKKPFQISSGEINTPYTIEVEWPVTI